MTIERPSQKTSRRLGAFVLGALLAACGTDGDRGTGGAGANVGEGRYDAAAFGNADASTMAANLDRDAGAGSADPFADNPCMQFDVTNLDVLFVVDDSGSMMEEQESLRREFPALVRALTTGDRDGDGTRDFPAVEDLHLGVVSTDMGLVGIQGISGCEGLGGDGVMNDVAPDTRTDCGMSYPRFLSYDAGNADSADQIASDFACVADLGTSGCGFEQPLEAGLKALWPSSDDRVSFLGDVNGTGTLGHGDVENAGFLRPASGDDASVLAIIVVTDEEDCSSATTGHFVPDIYLEDGNPLKGQDLNLRCFYNPQNLYTLDRYADGFRALRGDNDQLLVFGAIVGVPPELVDDSARAGVDFADPAARDAYYDEILADARMIEMVDTTRTPEQGGSLQPSCITEGGRAYPPRRLVQLAKDLGRNSVVQSICQDDFGPAIDRIVEVIGSTIDTACVVE